MPDPQFPGSFLEQGGQITLAVGKAVGELKPVVRLDTFHPDAPAGIPLGQLFEEVGGGVRTRFRVGGQEAQAGEFIHGGVPVQTQLLVGDTPAGHHLHIHLAIAVSSNLFPPCLLCPIKRKPRPPVPAIKKAYVFYLSASMLRMIAGLEEITDGELYIGSKLMNHAAPKGRDIAMVFQSYALYPPMTVFENMAFALKLRKTPKAEIDRTVRDAAEIPDITRYLDRKPKALSGGQRQRAAIGRAIVREPKVLLMDEPLSNLDAKLRNPMRTELIKLRQRINTTFIYVTHNQTEAMTLGDRIVMMRDGFIQQIGTPQEVFHHPSNLFFAGFTWNAADELLPGRRTEAGKWSIHRDYSGKAVCPGRPSAGSSKGLRPWSRYGGSRRSTSTYSLGARWDSR